MSRVPTAGEYLPGGVILVVEDDPLILEFLCEVLQDEGFVVQPQTSADAASRYLEQHAQNVRMLLTDITMPGKLNGADLANLFGDRWPGKPIMIMSGYETPKARACGMRFRSSRNPGRWDSCWTAYKTHCRVILRCIDPVHWPSHPPDPLDRKDRLVRSILCFP